jgi:glycosyltransferase involved in cell wall biosynthesis
MSKISIIIPIYNSEPYLRKCLDSIVNQTYKNLEIICVNDGSTDKSGDICDEYAKNDSRFVIIHKTNGGYHTAMNAGLDIFTGDFVAFVDNDDWMELNYYETVHQLVEEHDVDIVCTGFYKDTDEVCTEMVNKIPIDKGRLNREQVLRYTFIRDTYPGFGAYYWNKLFRAKFFRATENNGYNIRFENIKVASDIVLTVKCMLKANSAIYCDSAFYHWYQRENSQFHSKDIESRKGSLQAYSRILDLLEENNISSDIYIWVKRFYVYHASLLTEIALENKDQHNLQLMQDEIKRYFTEYIETNKDYPDRIKRINDLLEARL